MSGVIHRTQAPTYDSVRDKTIQLCSRCSEELKSVDGDHPPDGSDGFYFFSANADLTITGSLSRMGRFPGAEDCRP